MRRVRAGFRSKFRQINCLNKQLIQTTYSDIYIYSIYLKGKCREKRIIYKATLTSDDNTNNYFGSYQIEFKACFYNSNQSFEYQRKSNVTELSKAFWQWEKSSNRLGNCNAYYLLLIREKGLHAVPLREVRNFPSMPTTSLNSRTELMEKCCHTNKFKSKVFRNTSSYCFPSRFTQEF